MEAARNVSPMSLGIPVVSTTILMNSALANSASMVISTSTILFFATLAPVPLKLNRENYSFWQSLILLSIRAFALEDFLLATIVCPVKFISLTDWFFNLSNGH